MEVVKSRMKPRPEDAPEDYKPEFENYTEVDTINSMIPIWKRKKADVTDEEYNEFYKSDFHDFEDPARRFAARRGRADLRRAVSSRVMRPSTCYSKDYKKGLALARACSSWRSARNSFPITSTSCAAWMIHDLTLNISRETLQHNGQLKVRNASRRRSSPTSPACAMTTARRTRSLRRVRPRDEIRHLSTYGMAKDVLADLLLFYSAKQKKMITLDEYLADAPADSDAISRHGRFDRAHGRMPIVTTVLAKGHDVLLCNENVDEFCMMALGSYSNDSVGSWPARQ